MHGNNIFWLFLGGANWDNDSSIQTEPGKLSYNSKALVRRQIASYYLYTLPIDT